jgi:HK97 family phage prohead protease
MSDDEHDDAREHDDEQVMERPLGELHLRSSEVVGVSFPQREIDLVVIPYETEAQVRHPREARMITEVVSRGAFDGIERRANRVRVNRDHLVTRTVGRAVAFYPSREEGLVARVRIARTVLGDETLALADDEILDASAGFVPMRPDGETWESRTRCRIRRAWLAHIALTPEPAYETANVLAIRDRDDVPELAGSPNLASLQIEEWRAKLDEIDARYRLPGTR